MRVGVLPRRRIIQNEAVTRVIHHEWAKVKDDKAIKPTCKAFSVVFFRRLVGKLFAVYEFLQFFDERRKPIPVFLGSDSGGEFPESF